MKETKTKSFAFEDPFQSLLSPYFFRSYSKQEQFCPRLLFSLQISLLWLKSFWPRRYTYTSHILQCRLAFLSIPALKNEGCSSSSAAAGHMLEALWSAKGREINYRIEAHTSCIFSPVRTWKAFALDGVKVEDKQRKGVNAAARVELSRCYAKDVSSFF